MEASLHRLVAIGTLQKNPRVPRRIRSSALMCESLEGRQLLSTAGSTQMAHSARFEHVREMTHRPERAMERTGHGARMVMNASSSTATTTTSSTPATTTVTNASSTPVTTSSTTTSSTPATTSSTTTSSTPATSPPTSPNGPAAGMPSLSGGLQYVSGLLGGSPGSLVVLGGGGLGGGFGGGMITGRLGTGQQWAMNGSTSTSSSSSTTSTPPSSTGPTDQLKTDFQTLQTDTQAIQAKSQVTVAELTAVKSDFNKLQSEATSKPSQAKVTTLTNDITALNGQLPNATQTTQLGADYTAVLQSEGITDTTLITQTIGDINAVVQSANLTAADLTTLAADQTAIKNDLGSTAPTGSTGAPVGMGFPIGPDGWPLRSRFEECSIGRRHDGRLFGRLLDGLSGPANPSERRYRDRAASPVAETAGSSIFMMARLAQTLHDGESRLDGVLVVLGAGGAPRPDMGHDGDFRCRRAR